MQNRKFAYVKWEDISFDSSWVDSDKAKDVKGIICETVGWIVRKDRQYLCISSSRSELDKVADRTTIPRSNVRELRIIEVDK